MEEEFGWRPPTAVGRAQARVAHEARAKTTRTVPLDFEDNETGGHFDVVQDDDLCTVYNCRSILAQRVQDAGHALLVSGKPDSMNLCP